MKNIDEWHKIGDKLTSYLTICSCQRKLKSIIDNLWSIYIKTEQFYLTGDDNRNFTGAEWLLIAILDTKGFVTHGVNCEYPIISEDNEFWKWIKEIKDSPYLEDN